MSSTKSWVEAYTVNVLENNSASVIKRNAAMLNLKSRIPPKTSGEVGTNNSPHSRLLYFQPVFFLWYLSIQGKTTALQLNNSLKDWRKQLLVTAWKSAPTKAKFSSTAPSKIIYQHMFELENAGRSGKFKYLGSTKNKHGTPIKEVKIRLAQAHSAMTMLAILGKDKAISFPHKD